ncbi:MAG: hypothetical protein EP344_04045 [Bacteroidetes bacterium]|nr:MAG: hypothetical protein EP344_04045 [Bacteroidota bacterium]
MPANRILEAIKWHTLLRRSAPISLGKALLAVWVGVSVSLFAPNRIGEYGGRITSGERF